MFSSFARNLEAEGFKAHAFGLVRRNLVLVVEGIDDLAILRHRKSQDLLVSITGHANQPYAVRRMRVLPDHLLTVIPQAFRVVKLHIALCRHVVLGPIVASNAS